MSGSEGRADIVCQELSEPFIAKIGHTTAFTALAERRCIALLSVSSSSINHYFMEIYELLTLKDKVNIDMTFIVYLLLDCDKMFVPPY